MTYINKLVKKWPFPSSSLEQLIGAEKMLRQARADEISWSRSWACQAVLQLCALKHFQFDTTDQSLTKLIEESIELGLEFFYGDWWHKENVIQWCKLRGFAEDSLEMRGEPLKCDMLADPSKLRQWRDTLSGLMLLSTLTERHVQRAKICDWFGPDPQPEYTGMSWETEATTVVLAAYLRSQPMDGLDRLVTKIAKCKRPYARARLKLIQACFDQNQVAFSEALPEALDRFYESFKDKEPCVIADLLAVDESTIVHIAQSNGLVLPELTEKQRWAMLTPASIGINTTKWGHTTFE